jgi:hypothetical protein
MENSTATLLIEIFRNPEVGLPWCWALKDVYLDGDSIVIKRGQASRIADAANDAQDHLEIQEKVYRNLSVGRARRSGPVDER